MEFWHESVKNDLETVLFTPEQIHNRISEMAAEITRHYRQHGVEELVVIGILRGAVLFMSDLVRAIDLDVLIDFMSVSSYADEAVSSGTVHIRKDIAIPIKDRHVLIVEDIIDSGLTMKCLTDLLQARQPASLHVCSLLDKPARREVDCPLDFVGFTLEGAPFTVGFGLDYGDRYRNLPYIAALKPAVYQK